MAGWWIEVLTAPQPKALTLVGHQPTVTISNPNVNITPTAGTLTLIGSQPTVVQTFHQTITPTAGSLALLGHTPTVGGAQVVNPLPGALSITGAQPTVTVTQHQTIAPTAGTLSLTGAQPSVTATQNRIVTPTAGTLSLTGAQPSVATTAHQSITPTAGTLTLTGSQPTVTTNTPLSWVGANSNNGNTVTIPTHAIGDDIFLVAYRGDFSSTQPTKPTASGTVPAWVDGRSANTSFTAGRWVRFRATATNHTSGTWTGAQVMMAFVVRYAATSPIGGETSATNTSTVGVAPAITMSNTSGSSFLVQIYCNSNSAGMGASPASGYTRRTNSTVTGAPGACINTKDTTTSDGSVNQTMSGSSNDNVCFQIEILD